ncbi:MAG TPA: SDR family oxidoreductase [Aeromicrobium sp.]|nr:SDR family oxidoreductase [Aeromicrobium sp.]
MPGPHDVPQGAPSTDLTGSVAIVTGGGRGIGRILAAALANAGASVGLIARSADQLAETAQSLDSDAKVATAVADVTDEAQFREAIDALTSQLGPVDLLVNNAGMGAPVGGTWEVDPDEWWRTMDVNVRGVLLGCHLVMPAMVARGQGRIVNITSSAGTYRQPTFSAYSVSKAAVVKLTENLAVECKSNGVRVFSMHPGLTDVGEIMGELVRRAGTPGSTEARMMEWVERERAAGRVADPSLCAALIVRLAAGHADALAGCHLTVYDDLDAMVASAPEIRQNDLYMLRVNTLDAK